MNHIHAKDGRARGRTSFRKPPSYVLYTSALSLARLSLIRHHVRASTLMLACGRQGTRSSGPSTRCTRTDDRTALRRAFWGWRSRRCKSSRRPWSTRAPLAGRWRSWSWPATLAVMEAEDWEAVAMGVAMVAPLLAPRHLAHLARPRAHRPPRPPRPVVSCSQ